jgi:hypothetical protein
MSEEKKQEEKKETGPAIPWAALAGAVPGIVGAALGSGWPGIIALVLAGVALFFGYTGIIAKWNQSVDKTDADRAGADAGRTATDLANQARDVRTGLDRLEQNDPPKPPAPGN